MARRNKNKAKINASSIDSSESRQLLADAIKKRGQLNKQKLKESSISEGNKVLKLSTNAQKNYKDILEKFQSRPQEFKLQTNSEQIVKYVDDKQKRIIPEQEDEVKTVSNKKLRKAGKTTLAELKRSVPYPELIEWYDCDAPDPFLLASIKVSKNVVQVPDHWQIKKEYLAGRSLLVKTPFELPELIKTTDIEQMRNTLPENGSSNDQSLKEAARSRVQPKMGTLDIDYKKLHDVFFKLGVNWKPPNLLPFGDLYYEKRNMHKEKQWKEMVRRKKPGKLSKELREALGLQEGQLPPWCLKMKHSGLPPKYPNFKIAGLNWDIANLKSDTYGYISKSKSSNQTRQTSKLFGALLSVEDEISEEENESEPTKLEIQIESNQRQEINNYETTVTKNKADTKDIQFQSIIMNDNSGRPLYTILSENKTGEESQLTGLKASYNITNISDTNIKESESSIETQETPELNDTLASKFKF